MEHQEDKEHVTLKDNRISVSSDHGNETGFELSASHSQYLTERHGTTKLIPLPSQDPADPLNWPSWKVSPVLWQRFPERRGLN